MTHTQRGETVRSNSERAIADYFSRNNIRYTYEQPAFNRWSGRRISRPDFCLPEYGIYVEYWGMVGAEDSGVRSRYERSMKWKMAKYHQSDRGARGIYGSIKEISEQIAGCEEIGIQYLIVSFPEKVEAESIKQFGRGIVQSHT